MFHQHNMYAGHELYDIHKNQHAFAQGADAGQVRGRERRAERRRRADLRWLQHKDVGYAVDHHAYNARLQRSEEHTSELQSLMRISYAVFCLKKKKTNYKPEQLTQTLTKIRYICADNSNCYQ